MSAKDKIFREDLSEAERKGLTREELALWLTRPKKTELSRAKSWMIFRVSLLIAATVYYVYRYGSYGEITALLFLLFCYEAAYDILRKEKVEKDYAEALHSYVEKVEQFFPHGSHERREE